MSSPQPKVFYCFFRYFQLGLYQCINRLMLVLVVLSVPHLAVAQERYLIDEYYDAITLRFSAGVSLTVQNRVMEHLQRVSRIPVRSVGSLQQFSNQGQRQLLIAVGDGSDFDVMAWGLEPQLLDDLAQLPGEGFLFRSASQASVDFVFVGGKPSDGLLTRPYNLGLLYGLYELLERMGIAFLHPLEPTYPQQLSISLPLVDKQSPHWPVRAWHIHTQHPLELTHVLNGWGPAGPQDKSGWEGLLPEWESFLEWAVANKQNRVEWVLLMAASWQDFADSQVRQLRLLKLVEMGHGFGLAVGIDAPIAFAQQHSWLMLRRVGDEVAQLQWAVDWLVNAGFDYLEFEMGFSEFTHPDDRDMLAWMNEVTIYADETYNIPAYVKVHCTQNQLADHYFHPETQEPLNFNFLPYYADTRLGVMPHTVQYYALDGPAYTYDNTDFSFIREYMRLEAGRREVLYYPETAYWVTYDIDVPLFLPIYALKRVRDLRLIHQDEVDGLMGKGDFAGARIQGQVNFSSGWEWGYWLNDVVTARAAWNPHVDAESDAVALGQILTVALHPFGDAGETVVNAMVDMALMQDDLFLLGKVAGQLPSQYEMRNGQAYLQGWESWDEVGKLIGQLETKKKKMGMLDMLNPFYKPLQRPKYDTEIRPLLRTIHLELKSHEVQFQGIAKQILGAANKLYAELFDAIQITRLRAEQVYSLYEAAAYQRLNRKDKLLAEQFLNQAVTSVEMAKQVVSRQEQRYRVDADRIAGWNYNPTVYHYGYLWTVRSLHLWNRDLGKLLEKPLSPAYMNIIDPIDVANGEDDWILMGINLSSVRKFLRNIFGRESWVARLLYEPEAEPEYTWAVGYGE